MLASHGASQIQVDQESFGGSFSICESNPLIYVFTGRQFLHICRDRRQEHNIVPSFILSVIQQTLIEHIVVSKLQRPESSKTKQLLPLGRALSSNEEQWS